MASVNSKRPKQIIFRLHRQIPKTLPTEEDAQDFLVIANLMERRYKTGHDRRDEVEGWVARGYIKKEDAVLSFPSYRDTLIHKGGVEIDYKKILDRFEDDREDTAKRTDTLSASHKSKMNLAKAVVRWLKENHSMLDLTADDINDHLRSMRREGKKAQTRKHWVRTLKHLLKSAKSLKMIDSNPAEDANTKLFSVPKRPKYIKRDILTDEQCKLALRSLKDPEHGSYGQPTYKYGHKLSKTDPSALDEMPSQLSRSMVMDALSVGYSTLNRYVDQGVLPVPSRDRGHWAMKKSDLLAVLKSMREQERAMVEVEVLPEHTAMRGSFPLAFRLGLKGGFRNGEVVWLPWEHLDFNKRTALIGRVETSFGLVWSPKTDEDEMEIMTDERIVTLDQETMDYAKKELERQERLGIKSELVFPSGHPKGEVNHGKPVSTATLNTCFQRLLDRMGIRRRKTLTFYSLRHTYCTGLLRSGVDPETVRDLMGHARLDTTMTYMHPLDKESRVGDLLGDRWSSDD